MNRITKHRKYRLGNHLIATMNYHQHYTNNRDWGITLNQNENTWTLDLLLGSTIKVLTIRKNYYV